MSERILVALLQSALESEPGLRDKPLGQKMADAVQRFEKAQALGFSTISEMEEHERWLRVNGTAEFHCWLAGVEARA